MVRGVLTDITDELRHLQIALQITLERAEHDLSLRGLKSIDQTWDGTVHIVAGELHQLLVDEVGIADGLLGMVDEGTVDILIDPLLAIIRPFLVKGEVDVVVVHRAGPLEGETMVTQRLEIPKPAEGR